MIKTETQERTSSYPRHTGQNKRTADRECRLVLWTKNTGKNT